MSKAIRTSYQFMAVLLLSVAIVLISLRLYWQVAFPDDTSVKLFIAQELGNDFSLSNVEGRWVKGWRVEVLIDELKYQSPDEKITATLQNVVVEVDVLRSLLMFSPRLAEISAIGVEIDFRREESALPSDTIQQASNIETSDVSRNFVELQRLLLDTRTIRLYQLNLAVNDQVQGDNFEVNEASLHIENGWLNHRGVFNLPLLEGLGLHVEAKFKLWGLASFKTSWMGDAYLRTTTSELAKLSQLFGQSHITLTQGRGELESWASIKQGSIKEVLGSFAMRQLAVGVKRELESVTYDELRSFEHLSANFSAWSSSDNLLFEFEHIALQASQPHLDITVSGEVSWQGKKQAKLAINQAAVSELKSLATLYPFYSDRDRWRLDRVYPEGYLTDVLIDYEGNDWSSGHGIAQFKANNIGIRSSGQGLPSFKGVDGSFYVVGSRLVAQINSHDVVFEFNRLFEQAIHASQLSGNVLIDKHDDTLSVLSEDIFVHNGDATGEVSLNLFLPDVGQPYLDLYANYFNVDGASVSQYLPRSVVGEEASDWLAKAFNRVGDKAHGLTLYRGLLDGFPHYDHSGRFETRVWFDDIDLNYQDAWWPVEKVSGSIAFVGNGFALSATQGNIQNARLIEGMVELHDFSYPILNMHFLTEGRLATMRDYLSASPLLSEDGFLSQLGAEGDVNLDLVLDVPLDSKKVEKPVQAIGTIDFSGDNILKIANDTLVMHDVDGLLHFRDLHFSSTDLIGRYKNQQVALSVNSKPLDGTTRTFVNTQIKGELNAILPAFSENLTQLSSDIFQGEGHWNIGVQITQSTPAEVIVEVDSDLQGVKIDLPTPLKKPASATLPIKITADLTNIEKVELTADAGVFNAKFRLNKGGSIERASVRYGLGQAELPAFTGLIDMNARVNSVALDEWLNRIIELNKQLKPTETGLGLLDTTTLKLNLLTTKRAKFKTLHLPQFKGGLTKVPEHPWLLHINNDYARGELTYLGAETPMKLNFEEVDLDKVLARKVFKKTKATEKAALPEMDVVVGLLYFKGKTIPNLSGEVRQSVSGNQFRRLLMQADGLRISGEGGWNQANNQTQVALKIESNDLGYALEQLDFGDALKGGKIETGWVHLYWPGGISAFKPDEIFGQVDLTVSQGEFVDVEPGGAKFLQIFSLASLPRRLVGNFADLDGQGLFFDRLTLQTQFDSGLAALSNFDMRGPMVDMTASGIADFNQEKLDISVSAKPDTSALPVLATLLGGTGVGAPLLVVQQLFFKNVVSLDYEITGSMSQPKFEEKNTSQTQWEEEEAAFELEFGH